MPKALFFVILIYVTNLNQKVILAASVRHHDFDTTIDFNWDIKYANDIIDTLKKLGYHAELKSDYKSDSLYIKW